MKRACQDTDVRVQFLRILEVLPLCFLHYLEGNEVAVAERFRRVLKLWVSQCSGRLRGHMGNILQS
jgi:hypothetical protein